MMELPVIAGNVSQEDALRLMRGVGGGAVEMPDGFRIVTSQMIIDAADAVDVGRIAGLRGERLHDGSTITVVSDHGHVRFTPSRTPLRFEPPSGYKQCPKNGNHTYALDAECTLCPRDDAPLTIVDLKD